MNRLSTSAACAALILSLASAGASGAPVLTENRPVGDGWESDHALLASRGEALSLARLRTFVGDLQCDGSSTQPAIRATQFQLGMLLAAQPQNPNAWLANAEANLRAAEADCNCGGYRAAADAVRKAINADTSSALPYLTAVRLDVAQSQPYFAAEDVWNAQMRGATDLEIALAKAQIAQYGHEDQANIQLLLSAVEEIDQSALKAQAYRQLGDSYLRLRRNEEAEAAYRSGAAMKSCQSSPELALAKFLLFEKGDAQGAVDGLRELLQRLPSSDTKRLLSLADYYQAAGASPLTKEQRQRLSDLAQSAYATPEDAFVEFAAADSGLGIMKNLWGAKVISNIDVRDGHSNTALITAAAGNNLAAAKFLISKGANIDAENGKGHRALDLFCANGNVDAVKFLLHRKVRLDYVDGDGNTALGAAVDSGHADLVRTMLEAEAVAQSSDLSALLSRAAFRGNHELVQALLTARADINVSANGQAPPLIAAIMSRDRGTIALLLSHGADVNVSYHGRSAAKFAHATGDAEIIRLIERAVM